MREHLLGIECTVYQWVKVAAITEVDDGQSRASWGQPEGDKVKGKKEKAIPILIGFP
jgi:hypothetical protein